MDVIAEKLREVGKGFLRLLGGGECGGDWQTKMPGIISTNIYIYTYLLKYVYVCIIPSDHRNIHLGGVHHYLAR